MISPFSFYISRLVLFSKQMGKTKYQHIILSLLLVVWILVMMPHLKQILGYDPVIFPRTRLTQSELTMMLIPSILLAIYTMLLGFRELRVKTGTSKSTKSLALFLILFISVPIAYGYVYEQDIHSFTQTIQNMALMDENFDELPPGSSPPGWQPVGGTWSTADDDGNMVYYQDNNADKEALSISTTGNTSWTDYSYDVDVKFIDGNTNKDDRGALLLFRYQGGNSYYFLWMKEYTDTLELHNRGDGSHMVASTSCNLVPDTWYHAKIIIVGQTVDVTINDVPYFTDVDMNGAFNSGNVAIGTSYYKVMFDNIYVDVI